MIAVISPAKTMDSSPQYVTQKGTQALFLDEAGVLAEILKGYNPARLARLMSINPRLAQLNFERFQEWELPFTRDTAKQALFSFKGDVFLGIDAPSFKEEDAEFAQNILRILSGLYGVLKPLDLIRPYRLEMGSSLKVRKHKDLYHFWGGKIAESIVEEVHQGTDNVLVNLASKEYFSVLEGKTGDLRIVTPVFKDFKNGEYRFIHVFGKKARGLMVRFMIDRKITDVEELKLFDYEGYFYNDRLSRGDEWVFTRG